MDSVTNYTKIKYNNMLNFIIIFYKYLGLLPVQPSLENWAIHTPDQRVQDLIFKVSESAPDVKIRLTLNGDEKQYD